MLFHCQRPERHQSIHGLGEGKHIGKQEITGNLFQRLLQQKISRDQQKDQRRQDAGDPLDPELTPVERVLARPPQNRGNQKSGKREEKVHTDPA